MIIDKKRSKETCDKISATKTGKPNGQKGIPKSEAAKIAMSISMIGCVPHNRRPIICLNNGVVYESINHAAKDLNLWDTAIGLVCRNKQSHTKGYKFKYQEISQETIINTEVATATESISISEQKENSNV
jgi:hypothetical protein